MEEIKICETCRENQRVGLMFPVEVDTPVMGDSEADIEYVCERCEAEKEPLWTGEEQDDDDEDDEEVDEWENEDD